MIIQRYIEIVPHVNKPRVSLLLSELTFILYARFNLPLHVLQN